MTWRRTLLAAAMPAADPVASGLVASLARPGGKVTGNSIQGLVLGLKRLEILAEVLGRPARVAYLDEIFRGAKVADLPVEQAAKFDLLLNLTLARALGRTLPGALVLRADEVIE